MTGTCSNIFINLSSSKIDFYCKIFPLYGWITMYWYVQKETFILAMFQKRNDCMNNISKNKKDRNLFAMFLRKRSLYSQNMIYHFLYWNLISNHFLTSLVPKFIFVVILFICVRLNDESMAVFILQTYNASGRLCDLIRSDVSCISRPSLYTVIQDELNGRTKRSFAQSRPDALCVCTK